MTLPTIFQLCRPRPEILAGELPDSIFAADIWDVVHNQAHPDYQDPVRFFQNTYPTENLKILVKDVVERMAGVEGIVSVLRLDTGFGGGKTHGEIAATHAARHGIQLAHLLADYNITRFPEPDEVRVAVFVGEESDPSSGIANQINGQTVTTYTPWGQIALMAGGLQGYRAIQDNDVNGIVPGRSALEAALGDGPVLILLDELVLYMARCLALPPDNNRNKISSQWPTFFQTLFSVATRRPRTTVIVTLPSEKDANRKLVGELKQFLPSVLDNLGEVEKTAGRHAKSLTPTQSSERAAVLGKRLFDSVDVSRNAEIAQAYVTYYENQRSAGTQIDLKAFEAGYAEQIRVSYPFHPEFIRLFAERLADIPEFQSTRGALRLVGKTIRAAWNAKDSLPDAYLLQPHHVDLARGELRDEVLSRLGRGAFERGLDADVLKREGGTHANDVDARWPWKAATESALVVFLHSLPDGSRGLAPPSAALAVGRPGKDLAYVSRGLEETERRAWYMRREGEHFLFKTRASVNKRYQERHGQVQPGEARDAIDQWVQEVFSGFSALRIIPFPEDHAAVSDTSERIRLIIVHYEKECSKVGDGARLNFTRELFTKTGVNHAPRRYRNNMVFLLAESTRLPSLKEAVRGLIAWERVRKDIETEQTSLAETGGSDYRLLKDQARKNAPGVPAEFMALESDSRIVLEKLGQQELHVRTRLLDTYRVLAFPGCAGADDDAASMPSTGASLECYRVDLGEAPETDRRRRSQREAVAETPILQCLRSNGKLVPEAQEGSPLVFAPEIVRQSPLWQSGETRLTTHEVWDRIRSNPSLPMLLRPTDILPTFLAGVTKDPDALWVYYAKSDKLVYDRTNADGLSPVISDSHYLYDVAEAINRRIVPVAQMTSQEIWDHLWPKEGVERQPSVGSSEFPAMARKSAHYPVLPGRGVIWSALREGVRENRWILFLRGPSLAVGAQEMIEWPGSPRFEDNVEFWLYQYALDQGIYPRKTGGEGVEEELTPETLKNTCWPHGADRLPTEELERHARSVWTGLSRPHLEEVVLDGLRNGLWDAWHNGAEETYYTSSDTPLPGVRISPEWTLVEPGSHLADDNDALRPGRGPQPVSHVGTPREVMVRLWEDLEKNKDVHLAELHLTASDRNTLENTLYAVWPDRPLKACHSASVEASGEREVEDRTESIDLNFEGRFEQVRSFLAPVWPFTQQGKLDITVVLSLFFDPPMALDNRELERYRTELMSVSQGSIEAKAVPSRYRKPKNTG